MIYILEGPDCSGKTTLANKLVEMVGCQYYHFSYPRSKKEADNLFNTYYEKLVLLNGRNSVIDRMWISTMVYGEILRGKSEVSTKQAERLERLIHRDAMIFYCTGDVEKMWQRATRRGEAYIPDFETFSKICSLYDEIMYNQKHLIPIFTYDIEEGNNAIH